MVNDYDINGPYSHGTHEKRCREASASGVTLEKPFVLAKVAGVALCARLDAPWVAEGGRQMWRVQGVFPLTNSFHVPADRVRLCGQIDDRCNCEAFRSGRAVGARNERREPGPEGLTC